MNGKPTQQQKVIAIADELEKQATDSSHTDGRIMEKLGVSNGSFYRLKPKALLELTRRQSLQSKAMDDVITQETVEAVRNGLKSKMDRVMILQNEIDDCLKELSEDVEFTYVVVKGKLQKVSRAMTVIERTKVRQAIVQLQAEISRIQGDYAPNKFAPTDGEGNDLPPVPSSIDYTKLPDSVLLAIMAAHKSD